MDIKEILAGESKNIEFKENLPEKSIKYMKTVVAFANGQGGRIIFGVQDSTWKITGIPKDKVFAVMDSVTNAISDSCEPVIVPEISLQEVEGKTLIIVEIAPGMQRPYYIKSLGINQGTFIRVGGTSRPVESYMLRELVLEGTGRSFDCIPVDGNVVSDEEIEQVCADMTAYAKENCRTEEEQNSVRPLTRNQLQSWELLMERGGKMVPTYGFYLLSGKQIPAIMSGIQCAVFKGTTRAVFVDRREYEGPIYRQIDEAYHFVLRMIRMGAMIDGIVRRDIYEFPVGTVREMICNAVCHRSYLQPSKVQVALYDNRLEVTSPGMLSRDMTIDRMKEGYSKIRNRGIANAFSYMKMIEGWGSGIPRMIEECREYGLREPELIDAEGDFRINLYRKAPIEIGDSNGANGDTLVTCFGTKNDDFGDTFTVSDVKVTYDVAKNDKSSILLKEAERQLLEMLIENSGTTQRELGEALNVSLRTIKRMLSKLQEEGIVVREGSSRKGTWRVTVKI